MKKNNLQASALIITLMILGIVMVISLGIASSSLKERKSSLGSGRTVVSYQSADSGIERALALIMDVSRTNIVDIDDNCDGILFDLESVDYTVYLYDNSGTLLTGCQVSGNPSKSMIKKIKSIGGGRLTKQAQRAVEATVNSGP